MAKTTYIEKTKSIEINETIYKYTTIIHISKHTDPH
jgi:hypothetical protein